MSVIRNSYKGVNVGLHIEFTGVIDDMISYLHLKSNGHYNLIRWYSLFTWMHIRMKSYTISQIIYDGTLHHIPYLLV